MPEGEGNGQMDVSAEIEQIKQGMGAILAPDKGVLARFKNEISLQAVRLENLEKFVGELMLCDSVESVHTFLTKTSGLARKVAGIDDTPPSAELEEIKTDEAEATETTKTSGDTTGQN